MTKRYGILRYALLIFVTALFMFPLYWIIISSVKPSEELFSIPPLLAPKVISGVWYKEVFLQSNIPAYFVNSFVIAIGTTVISLVLSVLGGYSVTRFRYRGRNVILMALLTSYIFPPILLFLPLYLILSGLHLANTYFAVILAHTTITLPFSIWLLRAFFSKIPAEIEESAWIDGASRLTTLVRIVVPIVTPGLFSTAIFSFILSWNEYLYGSVLLTDEAKRTIPVGIAELITSFDIRWGAMMASATMATIPVIIFFVLIQRYFVQGLTAGAVKS